MSTLAVAALPGGSSVDGVRLLSTALAQLDAFDLAEEHAGGEPMGDAALGLQDIDGALSWARSVEVDGVIAASLDVGDVSVGYANAPSHSEEGVTSCSLQQHAVATVTGYIAIVDVTTGRTVLFEPVDHTYTAVETQCLSDDEDPTLSCGEQSQWPPSGFSSKDKDSLRLAALQDFSHTFAHRLTAHYEGEQVTLFVDRSLPQSERAIAALIAGDFVTAVNIYRAGVRESNTWTTPKWVQARAHYNLGTTLAFGGLTDEGLRELRRAQELAPSHLFKEQIQRAERYRPGSRPVPSTRRLWQCHRRSDNAPECIQVRS